MEGKRLKLLYVGDNEATLASIRDAVAAKEFPYDVDNAGNVLDVPGLLNGNSCGIILLDCALHNDAALDIIDNAEAFPVIFIAEEADMAMASESMKKGAYFYLIKNSKGIHPELLITAVEKVLYILKTERENKKQADQIASLNSELMRIRGEKALPLNDNLTGLANSELMNIDIKRSIARARRSGRPLSVLMIDIDYFSEYIDKYGRPAGDRLLIVIGKILLDEIRVEDLASRYSNEVFLVLLPDADRGGACNIAERIRKTIKDCIGITVSIGALTYERSMQNMEDFILRANAALSMAKEKGRDRVEVYG